MTIWLKLRGVRHVVVDIFAEPISHRVSFAEVARAFELAVTPGAAEKVVVTFD